MNRSLFKPPTQPPSMHYQTYRTWKVLYANQPTPDQSHVKLKEDSTYNKNMAFSNNLNTTTRALFTTPQYLTSEIHVVGYNISIGLKIVCI
jgi:hypothetical protein